jgi:hypothetical protein
MLEPASMLHLGDPPLEKAVHEAGVLPVSCKFRCVKKSLGSDAVSPEPKLPTIPHE